MKVVINRIFFIILFGFSSDFIHAQLDCDYATLGLEANPDSIYVGETSQLDFIISNFAGDSICYFDSASLWVQVSLPQSIYEYTGLIQPASGIGTFFTWTYIDDDPQNIILLGENYRKLYTYDKEEVIFEVKGRPLTVYPQSESIIFYITSNPFGPGYPSNTNQNNDEGETRLTVLGLPLPITLASFDATAESCNRVNLIWKTESELNNDYMEVQRSEDGREFMSLGKVKRKNLTGSATYTYTDTRAKSATTYFYRLRQVDFDGKVEFHKIISVRTKSCNDLKAFSIHPNPAINILNLGYDGFDNDEIIQCVVTNAIGELVRVYKDVTVTSLASIDVSAYKPGVYNIQIESNSNTFIKKFVKIY